VTRIIALTASLAAVAALAAGVSSAGAADKPSFADDLAARLGVSPDKLRDAFKATLTARIDAAVTAGLRRRRGSRSASRPQTGSGSASAGAS